MGILKDVKSLLKVVKWYDDESDVRPPSQPDSDGTGVTYDEFVRISHKYEPLGFTTEFIVCAANKIGNRVYPGYRHADCEELQSQCEEHTSKEAMQMYTEDRKHQGFLTSHNRWVDRKEAWVIANMNGQIRFGPPPVGKGRELISEHLYMHPEEL